MKADNVLLEEASQPVASGGRAAETLGRVLLVDDDPGILKLTERLLRHAGFEVRTATHGREAEVLLGTDEFHVVVSDIEMPGMDGIQLLRAVREHDLDLPVVLMTGNPAIETAVKAVEYGAFRYLVKPFPPRELQQVVTYAARLDRMARIKREAVTLLSEGRMQIGDRAGLEASFERALAGLWMAFQPLVSWKQRRVFGYEALLRSSEPTLPNPGAVIDAAERLGRLTELGRTIRERVAAAIDDAPPEALIFVNLHPRDLNDDELLSPTSPLARWASRIVLEITERSSLEEYGNARARVTSLRALGYRIAIDDLGAGYAGLTSFSQLEPEVVKLDMALVRDVDTQPIKQKLIGKIAELCRELRITVIAEGVETVAERDAVAELGCDIIQGFLFAKPGRGFPTVAF